MSDPLRNYANKILGASSEPTPVKVVRNGTTGSELAASVIGAFLRAWLVMLVIGALVPQLGVSYWQAWLGCVLVRLVVPGDSYVSWTSATPRKKRR
jgi:hypothetical protein